MTCLGCKRLAEMFVRLVQGVEQWFLQLTVKDRADGKGGQAVS